MQMSEALTKTPSELHDMAAELRMQAHGLRLDDLEDRGRRQQAAMLLAEARELAALARFLEESQGSMVKGLGDQAMTRETGGTVEAFDEINGMHQELARYARENGELKAALDRANQRASAAGAAFHQVMDETKGLKRLLRDIQAVLDR